MSGLPSLDGQSVLLTGSGGMLGTDLLKLLEKANAKVIATEKSSSRFIGLDITDAASVQETISKLKPDWIINCAAYTAVDKAEEEAELAHRVNGEGVKNLAVAAKEIGAKLCQISTDYVFDGKAKGKPLKEDDPTGPCGVYGHSKFEGEKAAREILPDSHLIVRTSWLHGAAGPNFVATMLRLGKELKELKIVSDQIGSPTYTVWLAEALIRLISLDARGTFHASSRGDISWYDFAKEIFEQANIDVKLGTQTTEELGRPAPRPAYSTLDLEKLEQTIGLSCPDWKTGVTLHLEELSNV